MFDYILRYNILNENDIEGEEDGIPGMDGEVKANSLILLLFCHINYLLHCPQLTPFNMKEELEEGHFDAEGHFQWNKDNDIKDNWLDNLDWVKVCAFRTNSDRIIKYYFVLRS